TAVRWMVPSAFSQYHGAAEGFLTRAQRQDCGSNPRCKNCQSLAPPNYLQLVQGVRYAAPLVGIPLLHRTSQCLFHDSLCLFDFSETLLKIGFLQYRPIQFDPVEVCRHRTPSANTHF